ncbi:hypothetical protein DIPPA_20093 [Diplonema papillatum]|nr:hypothetical protein DIPPA_20093 [Diplonema papillatum]
MPGATILFGGRHDYVHPSDACDAKSIIVYAVANDSAKEVGRIETNNNPSWVEVKGNVLVATGEIGSKGHAQVFDISKLRQAVAEGKELTPEVVAASVAKVHETPVGDGPCHAIISADEESNTEVVAVANYRTGQTSFFGIPPSTVSREVFGKGKIPSNPEFADRQEKPHAHHVCELAGPAKTVAEKRFLTSDLGCDQVDLIVNYEVVQSLKLPEGTGARRTLQLKRLPEVVYVLQELTHEIVVTRMKGDDWTADQTVSFVGGAKPLRWHHRGGSEFCFSPCEKYLLAATRTPNEIRVFSIAEDGALEPVSSASSRGATPRHLAFHGGRLFVSCHAIADKLYPDGGQELTNIIAVFDFNKGELTHAFDIPCTWAACAAFL